jgi:hypothetical protein
MNLLAPRYELSLIDKNGRMSREWYQFFVLLAKSIGPSTTSTDDLQSLSETGSTQAESIAQSAVNGLSALSTASLFDPLDALAPSDNSLMDPYPEEPVAPSILPKDLTLGAPSGTLVTTITALTNNAGAGAGTLLTAPAAGNPTKWIKINDAGTVRSIPAW